MRTFVIRWPEACPTPGPAPKGKVWCLVGKLTHYNINHNHAPQLMGFGGPVVDIPLNIDANLQAVAHPRLIHEQVMKAIEGAIKP